MKKRVGILTSGGDCPGLNATIRGVAKALYARMGDNVEIVGILNGYHGLITGDYKEMNEDDFRGILTLGGTILGTKRTPFKLMRVVEEDKIDKVAAMKKTYKDAKLDCLLCLEWLYQLLFVEGFDGIPQFGDEYSKQVHQFGLAHPNLSTRYSQFGVLTIFTPLDDISLFHILTLF